MYDLIDGFNYEIIEMIMILLKYIKIFEILLVFINVLYICILFKIKMDGVFLWRWRIFVIVLFKVFFRNLFFVFIIIFIGE